MDWAFIGKGIGGLLAAGSAYCVYVLTPKIHDYNSTRQILKRDDLAKYFEKEQEYSKIVGRIGELAKHPEEATSLTIARVLEDLRNSPFYHHDHRCKPAYKNLWILQAEKAETLELSRIHIQVYYPPDRVGVWQGDNKLQFRYTLLESGSA